MEIGSVGTSENKGRNNLDIDDVNVTLTDVAADTLNQAFGVNAFVADFNIGTAEVDDSLTLLMAILAIAGYPL